MVTHFSHRIWFLTILKAKEDLKWFKKKKNPNRNNNHKIKRKLKILGIPVLFWGFNPYLCFTVPTCSSAHPFYHFSCLRPPSLPPLSLISHKEPRVQKTLSFRNWVLSSLSFFFFFFLLQKWLVHTLILLSETFAIFNMSIHHFNSIQLWSIVFIHSWASWHECHGKRLLTISLNCLNCYFFTHPPILG